MFKKYEKMVDTTNAWVTKGVKNFKSKAASDHWVVTEKIHGANFSFFVSADSPDEVQCAKRDGVISPGDDFFGYSAVAERHAADVLRGYRHLAASHPKIVSVTFYGELYGGRYPHPDVAPSDASPVQQGVWYSPDVNWQCYDVVVATPDPAYLPFKEVAEVCGAVGLPCVRSLLVAPFTECINFKIPFQSTVPAQHGLPPLPSNTAEGIVVKSYAVDVLVDTVGGKKKARAIVKVKAEEFSEWGDKRSVAATAAAADSTALVRGCVNTNRLNAVLSKHGRLTAKTKPNIAKKMIADIVEDISATAGASTATSLLPEITLQVNAFIDKQ